MIHRTQSASFVAIMILLIALALPNTSQAFRSTKQESFTDPDYLEYQPKTVAILVISENLNIRQIIEERLTKELEKRGLKVYINDQLFPPTRQWDDEQRAAIYSRYSIEASIVVGAGESSTQVYQYGSQTTGSATANAYGNSATAYGSSQTTALMTEKSNASFSGILFDLRESRIAWTSDIYTKASGTWIVGEKGDAKAAVKGIIKGLVEHKHIPKK